jgi:hypothetical protein
MRCEEKDDEISIIVFARKQPTSPNADNKRKAAPKRRLS